MLTFAMEHDWIESNPAWRMRKPGEERSRDRVLSRDELRELRAALHEIDSTPQPRLVFFEVTAAAVNSGNTAAARDDLERRT